MKHLNKYLVMLSSLLIVFSASSLAENGKSLSLSTADAAVVAKGETSNKSNSSDSGFTFEEHDDFAEITAYSGKSSFVKIPSEYNGKIVKKAVLKTQDKSAKIISVTVPDTLEELTLENTESLMQICGSEKGCGFDSAKEYGVCFTKLSDYSSYLDYSESDGFIQIKAVKTDAKLTEYIIPAMIDGVYVSSLSGQLKANDAVTLRIENGNIDLSEFSAEGNVTINGFGGSTAQKFAYSNKLKFVPIESKDCGCRFTMYGGYAEAEIISGKSDIVIPETWQGTPVHYINRYVISPYIRSITIPESVTQFGDTLDSKRFAGASSLKTIYGVTGSFAESIAKEMKVEFCDIAASDFEYEKGTDSVKVKKILNGDSDVVIPEKIEGTAVTEVDISLNSACVKSITVPDCVTKLNIEGNISGLCVYGEEGSVAQEFAVKNKCAFRYAGLPDEAYFHYIYRNDKADSPKKLYAVNTSVWTSDIALPSEMYGEAVYGINIEKIDEEKFSLNVPENIKDIITEKNPTFICGQIGSFAQEYAEKQKIRFCADAGEDVPQGIKYALYADTAEIYSLDAYAKERQTLEIMPYIDGKCVTSISDEALHYSSDKPFEIAIPKTVTQIGTKAVVCDESKKKNIKIKGTADSAAKKYADDNGFEFVEIIEIQPEFEFGSSSSDKKSEKNTVCGIKNADEADFSSVIAIPDSNDGTAVEKIEGFPEKFCQEFTPVIFEVPACIKSIECSEDDLSDYNITIVGEKGSYAEKFAAEKNFLFEYSDSAVCNMSVYTVKSGTLVCLSKDMTSLDVPDTINGKAVAKLTKDTFAGCSKLRSVTVYSSDAEFDKPFADCPELEEIRGYSGSTAQTYASENKLKFVCLDEIEYVQWNDTAKVHAVVPENITKLGKYDFVGCTALKSLTINNSALTISDDAFSECPNLSTIYGIKGSSVESAARKHGFVFIEIQNNSGYIAVSGDEKGYTVSEADKNMTCADIPKEIDGVKITAIADGAFEKCINISSIIIPETVKDIGSKALAEDAKNVTICGYSGSAAEKFAEDRKLKFMEIKTDTESDKTAEKNKDSEKSESEKNAEAKDGKDISDAVIYVDTLTFAYDGKPHTASYKIVMGDKTLKEGTDYKISGKSAQDAGSHMLTATGMGEYKGSVAAVWRIAKTCEVVVNINGTKSKTVYEENTNAEVEAPDIDGKKFSHWECNGKEVSSSQKYSFVAEEDTILTAVYTDDKSKAAETTATKENAETTAPKETSKTTSAETEPETSSSVHTEKIV